MIIEQTFELLRNKYKIQLDELTIKNLRFGVNLSAVELSDGTVGVASTLNEQQMHGIKKCRDFGDFTPLNVQEKSVGELFETEKKSNLINTLKVAVLNAISSKIIEQADLKIINYKDPIDIIDIKDNQTVTIVGGFNSYIKKLINKNINLHVLELNEDALIPEHKKFYIPAADYRFVLPKSDVVIITGLTLVNNTIDGLLSVIPEKAKVAVTGPSSNIIPDVLFDNKVDIIGATRITKPDVMFELVSQYASGFHLFEYCAEKICIVNE